MKDGAYIIKLDKYKSIGAHGIALYVNDNNGNTSFDATYFDSFGAEKIPNNQKINRKQKCHNQYL